MRMNTCMRQDAALFLKGTMSKKQEDEYQRHLDSCADCQRQIEQQAADEREWADAGALLAQVAGRTGSTGNRFDAQSQPSSTVQLVLNTLSPTDDPNSLGRIDSYEITGVIGSGAMGVVLKAEDRSLDRIVAVKVMSPSLAASGAARSRFAREAKAAAAILHANVIAIYGVCTTSDLPYLVMPYLKGMSVEQRVNQQGPLSVAEILRIGSQIASGLEAAHQQGVIHRDIKPSNVMLDAGVESAIITDFGLARTIDDATMTRTGVITGTPEYMSPEQARGEYVDCKSDLYSLGSFLYMLCTGHAPFRAQTPFGVLRRISDDAPRPIRQINSEIPDWLCRIIERLQEKDPADRPTASEAHQLLEGCLAHVHQPDQIDLPDACRTPQSTVKTSPFRPLTIGVTIMLAFLAISVLFILFPIDGDDALEASKKSSGNGLMAKIVPGEEDKARRVFKTVELQFPRPKQTGNLKIDINRGFVEVAVHDKPGVVIEILYPTSSPASEKPGSLEQQFAPTYDLDVDVKENLISLDTYNQDYPLNLLIKVPQRTNLSLDTYYDGYLEVQDVRGKIVAESQNCDISLMNISGSAVASSYNGDFKISFREVAEDAVLDFESYNGSVDLTFPDDTKLTAAVRTGRGRFGSAFKLGSIASTADLAGKLKDISEYTLGSINGGGIPLRIESEKGVISLRKSTSK